MRQRSTSRILWTMLVAAFILLLIVLITRNSVTKHNAPVPIPITPPTPVIAVSAPSPTPILVSYEIREGDTLTKIAETFCHTVLDLAETNSIKNPDIIYTGKTLTFVKVEPCSPESVKSKTFPEKHVRRVYDGASREKLLPPDPKRVDAQITAPATSAHTFSDFAPTGGCAHVGSRISDFAERIMVRAECIKALYGEFISDALRQDPRVTAIDVMSIMLYESKGDPLAVSKARVPCLGLMQLQPPTAAAYDVDTMKIFDPRENIRGGVRVFVDYTYAYFGGNKDYGLAAYNRGPNSKLLYQRDFDPNSLAYVQNVKKIMNVLTTNHFAL